MTNASKKDRTAGEIVNIMAEDTDRLINESNIIFFLFTSPIQVRALLDKNSKEILWEKLGANDLERSKIFKI